MERIKRGSRVRTIHGDTGYVSDKETYNGFKRWGVLLDEDNTNTVKFYFVGELELLDEVDDGQ